VKNPVKNIVDIDTSAPAPRLRSATQVFAQKHRRRKSMPHHAAQRQ
jgi:hypothetical protein